VSAIERVAAIIPAHNEGALIGRCVASVRRALAHPALDGLDRWIVVAADRCADDTAERGRRALARSSAISGEVLDVDVRSAGRARAAGVAAALARWTGADPATVWLANTDADTSVSHTWLARQLEAARAGWAGVAGIIDVDTFAGHRPGMRRLFRATYALPADRPHPHVHGCNLGVRADAYLDAGGWPPRDVAEDHGLWNALRSRGWPCLSDRTLLVITSGRPVGRAPGGFADALVALGAA
jgi:glycosyltransferase involved in cell wall biosynthesis